MKTTQCCHFMGLQLQRYASKVMGLLWQGEQPDNMPSCGLVSTEIPCALWLLSWVRVPGAEPETGIWCILFFFFFNHVSWEYSPGRTIWEWRSRLGQGELSRDMTLIHSEELWSINLSPALSPTYSESQPFVPSTVVSHWNRLSTPCRWGCNHPSEGSPMVQEQLAAKLPAPRGGVGKWEWGRGSEYTEPLKTIMWYYKIKSL